VQLKKEKNKNEKILTADRLFRLKKYGIKNAQKIFSFIL